MKKRINLAVIFSLLLLFAASGFLLYLPTSEDTNPSASPSPGAPAKPQQPFGY